MSAVRSMTPAQTMHEGTVERPSARDTAYLDQN